LVSEYGVTKGEGWHKAGSMAAFSVSTPVAGEWAAQYLFKQWTGDSAVNSATSIVLMDGPKQVMALWIADYSQFYVFVTVIVGVAAIVVATLVAWRRRLTEPITKRTLLH